MFQVQILASLTCYLAVIMAAVCFVWMEPLLRNFLAHTSLVAVTEKQTYSLVSFIEISEMLFTLPAGILADKYGRRIFILSTGPMCLSSFVVIILSRDVSALYVARFIQGAVAGIVYSVVPMYIAEVAEPSVRGKLGAHVQTSWHFGILFAYITGPYMSYMHYNITCALVAVLFISLYWTVPETPYYLVMVGRDSEAYLNLLWLRSTLDVNQEFLSIKKNVSNDLALKGGFTGLISTRKSRKAFFVVQIICCAKYLSGLPAIVSYATQIFEESRGGYFSYAQLTIFMGVLLCLTNFLAASLSDIVGRKPLLFISTLGTMVFNLFIGLFYFASKVLNLEMDGYSWFLYSGIVGVCIFSNIGLGPILQTLQAEMFPTHIRGRAGGLTELIASLATFVNLKQYELVSEWVGQYMNFFIFAAFALVGAIVGWIWLPETAGKTFAEIQTAL